jgi:hypothetical protein
MGVKLVHSYYRKNVKTSGILEQGAENIMDLKGVK